MIKHGLNLPDEHLIALGHVAVRSSQMEHMLEFTINSVMSGSKYSAEFILSKSQAKELPKLLKAALLDLLGEGIQPEAEALVQKIGAAKKDRNDLLHYIWGSADDTGTALSASMRPNRPLKERRWTANEINGVAMELLEVTHALREWYDRALNHRINSQPLPWPDKPEGQSQPRGLLGHLDEDH